MKKIVYFAIAAILFTACSQSKEQKAEALIKKEIIKSLYKPDTYKSIETKLDSAFAPIDDPKNLETVAELSELSKQIERLESTAKYKKSSMAIWSGPYTTAYERNQYQEAKEEYNEAISEIETLREKGIKLMNELKEAFDTEKSFIGYKVTHNYRADNNAGQTLIGNVIFFVDNNLEEILYSIDADEYTQKNEAIKLLIEEFQKNMN